VLEEHLRRSFPDRARGVTMGSERRPRFAMATTGRAALRAPGHGRRAASDRLAGRDRAAPCTRRPSEGELSADTACLVPTALAAAGPVPAARVLAGARRDGRAAARRAAAAAAVAAVRAAEHRTAAAVRRSLRTDSAPRANRTGRARHLDRIPVLAVRSHPAAADPAAAGLPNRAAAGAAGAAALAGRTETLRAADVVGVGRSPAAPNPLAPRRTRRPVEVPGLLGQRVPVAPVLRKRDKTCWWAGSGLHSERRRSFWRNSRPRPCPRSCSGQARGAYSAFAALEQSAAENADFCP
jgi:hypothetical protein